MERTIKPEVLKPALADKHLIDVRRRVDLDASPEQFPVPFGMILLTLIVGTRPCPKDKEIVLYCVRGGSVSNAVVDTLQAKGFKARYIDGGIEGWKARGGEHRAKVRRLS